MGGKLRRKWARCQEFCSYSESHEPAFPSDSFSEKAQFLARP